MESAVNEMADRSSKEGSIDGNDGKAVCAEHGRRKMLGACLPEFAS